MNPLEDFCPIRFPTPKDIPAPPISAVRPKLVSPEVFLKKLGFVSAAETRQLRKIEVLEKLKEQAKGTNLDALIQTVCTNAAKGENQLELEALGELLKERRKDLTVPVVALLSYLLIMKMAATAKLTCTAEKMAIACSVLSISRFQDPDLDTFQFLPTPSWIHFSRTLLLLNLKTQLIDQTNLEEIFAVFISEKNQPSDLDIGMLLLLLFCDQNPSEPFSSNTAEKLCFFFSQLCEEVIEKYPEELAHIFENLLRWAENGMMKGEGVSGILALLQGIQFITRDNFPPLMCKFAPIIKKYPHVAYWLIGNLKDNALTRLLIKP